MVFSSFVGCIETDDEKTDTVTSPSSLGNVIVSTYHVAELVRGVGGDRVTVEIISPSNVPVHDYEPSAADLIRLQDVDLFFYHGLNLEPWVDATISSLGSDAPLAVQTHAMPTGENTLDYQSMLLSEICETLNDDAFEAVTLADHHDEAGDVEIHAEAMTHKVSYPEMDDDHGDDDHGDDDHGDDHDAHAEHNHASAEKVIQNPAGCPSDTVVSVFHLEEGEYLLEFEYGAATEFDMVVLKMMGGHAHHDHHGHDEHGDDHDDNETHDDHDDNETHDDHDDHDDHDGHDDHGEDHHQEMTDLMAIFNNSDADGDGFLNLTELEHFIPAVDEYDDDGHDDHDDHDDHDGHDDNETHDDDHDGNETHDDDHDGNETHDDDHDDHDGNGTHDDDIEGDDVPTPQDVLNFFDANNDSLLSFDEFWHAWEEGDDDNHDGHEEHPVAFATLHVEEEGDYGFALPSGIEYFILMGEGGHDDHDDHGDDHDDHGDDEDHSDEEDHSDDGSEIVADEDEEAFDYDPHSWLSPVAYKAQVDVVLNALITAFPDGEADFKANAEAYSAELDKLDLDYTAAFGAGGTCEAGNAEKTIVANHNAYAYISERYDIEILTVHGLDPEGEPSAADIAEVVEQIEEKNITVLYVEEYTDTSSVDSIVQQTGVTIEILYTMELPPKNSEDTYLTLMGKNLDSLVEGMGC